MKKIYWSFILLPALIFSLFLAWNDDGGKFDVLVVAMSKTGPHYQAIENVATVWAASRDLRITITAPQFPTAPAQQQNIEPQLNYGRMFLADRLVKTNSDISTARGIVRRDLERYSIDGVLFFTSRDGLGASGHTDADGYMSLPIEGYETIRRGDGSTWAAADIRNTYPGDEKRF
ncbi:MAG: hypothetical protein LBG12_02120 [Synergistaceae bacterium]|jgi:hypothetical protein|nr:hypothetical protein [Synergistaceae bacterium]